MRRLKLKISLSIYLTNLYKYYLNSDNVIKMETMLVR